MLWWALAEGAVVLWFGLPFLAHRRRCMKAMRSPWTPKTGPIEMEAMPEVVVLLPTWNETAVIERRLANLAAQHIEGQTEGPDVALSEDEPGRSSFRAAPGKYTFELTVTDAYGAASSQEARVNVTSEPNTAPEVHMSVYAEGAE